MRDAFEFPQFAAVMIIGFCVAVGCVVESPVGVLAFASSAFHNVSSVDDKSRTFEYSRQDTHPCIELRPCIRILPVAGLLGLSLKRKTMAMSGGYSVSNEWLVL